MKATHKRLAQAMRYPARAAEILEGLTEPIDEHDAKLWRAVLDAMPEPTPGNVASQLVGNGGQWADTYASLEYQAKSASPFRKRRATHTEEEIVTRAKRAKQPTQAEINAADALAESAPDFDAPPRGDEDAPVAIQQRGGPGHRECTDLGNAERLIDSANGQLRYVSDLKLWRHYDGVSWVDVGDEYVLGLAAKVVKRLHAEAARATGVNEIGAWAHESQSATRLKAMVSLARSDDRARARSSDFDRDGLLFNVANGTLDLRTGQLRPHSAEDLITKLSPVSFDPAATCPRFDTFLSEAVPDEAARDFLVRWLGYCLTAETDEHVVLFILGDGGDGKSVLLVIIGHVMGSYAAVADKSVFIRQPNGRGTNEQTVSLRGIRFAASSELNSEDRLDEGALKVLTGGEKVTGRELYQSRTEFLPTCKLTVASNHAPRTTETSEALRRRMRILRFTQCPPDRRDRGLGRKLRQEAPGVLNLMLRGLRAVREQGLGAPDFVMAATSAYFEEMGVLDRFVRERLEFTVRDQITKAALRAELECWAEVSDLRTPTDGELRRKLTQHGVIDKKMSDGWNWLGLRLKTARTDRTPNPELSSIRVKEKVTEKVSGSSTVSKEVPL
jgi:putative DNA primase/helicase